AGITGSSPLGSSAFTGYGSPNGCRKHDVVFRGVIGHNSRASVDFDLVCTQYNDPRYLNARGEHRYRSQGQPFSPHLSELPGFGHKLYRKYDGEGVLDISDGKTHDVEIRVQDVHGNASLIKFKIRYDGTPVKPGTQKGKTFYPNMLDGFE